jgi:hypothetical protein
MTARAAKIRNDVTTPDDERKKNTSETGHRRQVQRDRAIERDDTEGGSAIENLCASLGCGWAPEGHDRQQVAQCADDNLSPESNNEGAEYGKILATQALPIGRNCREDPENDGPHENPDECRSEAPSCERGSGHRA